MTSRIMEPNKAPSDGSSKNGDLGLCKSCHFYELCVRVQVLVNALVEMCLKSAFSANVAGVRSGANQDNLKYQLTAEIAYYE